MDHTYIDDNSMAERYLRHVLTPQERSDFEEHLVDCEECGDRVLLAEMFLVRNGNARESLPLPGFVEKLAAQAEPREQLTLRARIGAQMSWHILFILVVMVLILLSIPAVQVFLQDLHW